MRSTDRMIPPLMRECMPTSTFSRLVIVGNRRMFWNVRPTPRCVTACGGRPATSRPSNRISPEVGVYTPVSMLKNVVLPAPFGPIRLDDRAARDDEVDVVAGHQAAELLAHAPSPRAGCRPHARARVVERAAVDAELELGPAAPAGNQALGPQQHHHDDDEAEDAVRVLRDIEVRAGDVVDVVAHRLEALVVQVREHGAAEADAPDVAHPAQDHHAQHGDRDVEREVAAGTSSSCRSR